MDKNKAKINITVSIVFRFVTLIIALFSRRYLVLYLGSEANGIYSLFVSILGFLSIAELGIGTAITFSMYKPIVDDDKQILTGLYNLYRKFYLWIGIIVLIGGLAILPFLPLLAKDNTGEFNLYITYLIFLVSALLTYLYAYKTSFINAHKDNYITTIIRSVGLILEAALQIVVIVVLQSFIGFFLAILVSGLLQWGATNIIFQKKYKSKLSENSVLPDNVKREVTKNTKAMFIHKIGGLLVTTSTSIIISALISVTILGKYSNYILIMTGMSGVLTLIFSSITSIVGHSFATNSVDQVHSQFKKIYSLNFIIGLVLYSGFYAVASNIVFIIFGSDQIVGDDIVLFISINYFILFMRSTTLLFKDASGNFFHDRFKPLFEGILNIVLSLILINSMGILGILLSHIIANLFICHIVEPFVLYKYGFEKPVSKYYFINYLIIILFVINLLLYKRVNVFDFHNPWINLLVNGGVSITISLTTIILLYIFIIPFKKIINGMLKTGFASFRKK